MKYKLTISATGSEYYYNTFHEANNAATRYNEQNGWIYNVINNGFRRGSRLWNESHGPNTMLIEPAYDDKLKMKITVVRRGNDDFKAYLNDNQAMWSHGTSMAAAIGNLIITWMPEYYEYEDRG